MFKESRQEKDIKKFAYQFVELMGWDAIQINRVKISRMVKYKGLCLTEDCESVYLVISETANTDNKDFFATLIHELIHAHLLVNKKRVNSHHKHNKRFKKLAKKVEKKTNGFYTAREII